MNNTIPFKSTSRTIRSEQITVDVGILSVLNHAASPGRRELDSNIYLAAIAPDMELNIIMEEDAPTSCPASMKKMPPSPSRVRRCSSATIRRRC